jgi:hypothetical protein
MEMKNEDQIWLTAYGVSMGLLTLGDAIRGVTTPVEQQDTQSKAVADRVLKTVEERAQIAAAAPKGRRS